MVPANNTTLDQFFIKKRWILLNKLELNSWSLWSLLFFICINYFSLILSCHIASNDNLENSELL